MILLTDVFSKFSQVVSTRVQQASTVADVLTKEWFYKYSVPARLHSDQGRSNESTVIQQLCAVTASRSLEPPPSSSRKWPGLTLLCTLSAEQKHRWLEYLTTDDNTIPHQTTGQSPFLLMFGQEPQLPVDFLLCYVEEPATEVCDGSGSISDDCKWQ